MIRLVLEPGPQRGSDVRQWVAEASGYQRSKVLDIAKQMEARGALHRSLWALEKSPLECVRRNLVSRLSQAEPISLEEMVAREWRVLMGAEEE